MKRWKLFKRGKVYRIDGSSFAIFTYKMTRESIAALYDHIRYKLQISIEVNSLKQYFDGKRRIMEVISVICESFNNDCEGFNLEYLLVIDAKTETIHRFEMIIFLGKQKIWENFF